MREGGTLGFFCRYQYNNEFNECRWCGNTEFRDAPFPRGDDMIIYRVAKSLGLSVQLKAICGGLADEDDEESCMDFIVPSFQQSGKL